MPRFYIPLFLLLVLSYPAMAARDVIAGPMTGDVMQVLDGDTVTVRVRIWIGQSIETSVRINGIDTPEMRGLRARLNELREEHRALDSAIFALQEQSGGDALQLARLNKRKLVLRDQIQWIEDRLTPDIIA